MKNICRILFFLLAFSPSLFAKKVEVVQISTSMGDIYVWLYKDTPIHRKNFLKLAKKGFFDGTTFHRVIKNFMIQGGDPYSRMADKKDSIGEGGPGYELKAEIHHMHKRGTLAAARNGDEVNPEQKSSGSQFYIVHGRTYTDEQLNQAEDRINSWWKNDIFCKILYYPKNKTEKQEYLSAMLQGQKEIMTKIRGRFQAQVDSTWKTMKPFKFTPAQREIYKTAGGAAHLDGNYTAFGEVLKGMDVVDKIAATKTGPMDRPVQDIPMTVKVLKMSAKEFKKTFGTDPPKDQAGRPE